LDATGRQDDGDAGDETKKMNRRRRRRSRIEGIPEDLHVVLQAR
jgi:hypothetical protein